MQHIRQTDPQIADIIAQEEIRQHDVFRMIASENYASRAVQEACGTVLSNKYSEGYPQARYYQGQSNIDKIETIACQRACEFFQAQHANVQPYSGSPANLAVYLGLLGASGTILGMALEAGGHLTHGAKVSASGKYYQAVQYGVRQSDARIDYDQVLALARIHRPQMIICGHSAYPRTIDFGRFREIADEVGAYLLADISHISGLCATGLHPNPCVCANAVVKTTNKLLRGPRGGLILCRKQHAPKIDKAVFPGLQGGPHNAVIAGIAVALKEARSPSYRDYCAQVVENARTLAEAMARYGFRLITGGTDNHLILVDATSRGVPGKVLAQSLEQAGIVCNYNKIPFDSRPANDPSGIRLGTPAVTSRGMKASEMEQMAKYINRVAKAAEDTAELNCIAGEVKEICSSFPAPGI